MKFSKPLKYLKLIVISCWIILFFIIGLMGYYVTENSHLNLTKHLDGEIIKAAECKKIKGPFDQSGKRYLYHIDILYS